LGAPAKSQAVPRHLAAQVLSLPSLALKRASQTVKLPAMICD
jgi:hypothetical protein